MEFPSAFPLQSMGNAGIALARQPLSKLEHLWYTHTESVPDATLYSVTVVLLFIVMHAVGISTLLLTRLLPSLVSSSKLQPRARNSLASVIHAYIAIVLVYGLAITPILLYSDPVFKLFLRIRVDLPLPSLGEIVAQNTVYFLVQDYVTYWLHRWYHTEWAYTTFHHVHHEYSSPESSTSIYAHALEVLFGFLPTLGGVFLIPPHIITFWIWLTLDQLHTYEIHSGYDLYWNPTKFIPFYGGSKYHDYHHQFGTKCASNFALGFTILDTIYGTNKGYLYRERQAGRKDCIDQRTSQTHEVIS